MGIPILTSEGFVGQRWIIDDYFQAGETLHAGDVVGVQQGSASQGNHPRVFKIDGDVDKRRVIGIVHTPAAKQVGDEMASDGDHVAIVVKGIAKALCTTSIGVGDPVMASGSSAAPTGKTGVVATVMEAAKHNHNHTLDAPDDGMTSEEGEHTHTISAGSQDPTEPPPGSEF